jgi:hypothetical protein
MKQEPPVNPDLHNRNDSFQSDVAAYAPRFPDFLKNRATPVEVSEQGETKATATYVDGEIIKQAVLGQIPFVKFSMACFECSGERDHI